MYLLIDQYGNKSITSDIKHRTLKNQFYAGSVKPCFVDKKNGGIVQTGFVIGQGRGQQPLWVEVFKLEAWEKPIKQD